MLQAFSLIYLTVLVFVACDNTLLPPNTHDFNALMAFLSLVFLCMAFVLRKEKEGYGVSALSISLILFLLYSSGSFYFSLNADLSIYPALKLLSALFLAIALIYFLKDIEILKKALFMVFAFAGLMAASGVVEQFFPFLLPSQGPIVGVLRSFFQNPNFFAGYLIIHVPIGVYLYFRASSLFEKVLTGLGWILILVSLGLSKSQGGQLAAGLQIFVIIRYFLARKEPDRAKLVILGTLISILIYLVLSKLILAPDILPLEKVDEIEIRDPWVFETIVLRLLYWSGAWRIFTDHWLLGSGLWTFVELYPQTGLDRLPAHAHNLYLQTAAETGLIGLGLLIVCLTTLCSTVARIFKKGRAEVVAINFYIAASLAGFLLHNISEYNWLTANFIYYFVFLLIAVEVLNRETQGREKWVLMFKGTVAVPIIVVLGAFTVLQYYSYQRIISHNIPLSNTLNEMSSHAERAKDLCHQCGKPHYVSGIARLEMYRLSQNSQDLVQAEQDFNEAIRRNPNGLGTYLLLARTKTLQGNISEARKYYKKAMKDPRYRSEALSRFINLGKSHDAVEP